MRPTLYTDLLPPLEAGGRLASVGRNRKAARARAHVIAVALIATASLAACDFPGTGPGDASFLKATVEGSLQAEYAGTGSFRILPPAVPSSIRFSLFSRGVGASESQSFHFQGRYAPVPGSYTIQELKQDPLTGQYGMGELEEDAYFAFYEVREASTLKIFSATSGTIHVTESRTEATPRRIAGTFQLTGRLTLVCTISPGFPGNFLECDPATEDATVEITGSFKAGPLGGDNPGLIPYPG